MKKLCLFIIFYFLIVFIATSASASVMYGAAYQGRNSPSSSLYLLNSETGEATLVGEIGFNRVSGMDFNPDGTLYATGEQAWGDGSCTPVLIKIDTESGVGTKIKELHFPGYESRYIPGKSIWHRYGDAISDISFRSDGKLYAYLEGGDGLATINMLTGELTDIGWTGVYGRPNSTIYAIGGSLAFSLSDELFHANEYAIFALYQEHGGESYFINELQFPPLEDNIYDSRINGMDFDPETGVLYGSLNDGWQLDQKNYLTAINTTNGEVTVIGNKPTVDGLTAIAITMESSDESCFRVNELNIERKDKDIKCKGIAFMKVTSDKGVLEFWPEPGKEKLCTNTVVDDGINGPQTIHTSCSKPIEIGDVYGAYTITCLDKIFDDDTPDNKIKIKGTFDPFNPIDLATDEVIYTIGEGEEPCYIVTIPAGSFEAVGKPKYNNFKFNSEKGDKQKIEAKFDFDKCEFELEAEGVMEFGEISSTRLTISLLAGNNFSEEVVKYKVIHVEYKASLKAGCCPK